MCLLSFFDIAVLVVRFVTCPSVNFSMYLHGRELRPESCQFTGYYVVSSLVTMSMGLLFALFTLIMVRVGVFEFVTFFACQLFDQLSSIVSNQTGIEHLSNSRGQSQPFCDTLREVMGTHRFGLSWLLPLPIRGRGSKKFDICLEV